MIDKSVVVCINNTPLRSLEALLNAPRAQRKEWKVKVSEIETAIQDQEQKVISCIQSGHTPLFVDAISSYGRLTSHTPAELAAFEDTEDLTRCCVHVACVHATLGCTFV